MCVIITIPAGKTVSYSHLRAGNATNPHGWGLAVRLPDGTMRVERGFSSNSLVHAYKKYEGNDIVVHCRIGTSGLKDLSNTHPFEVVPGVLLFHNGVFSRIPLTNLDKSDTWHLAQQLRPVFEEHPDILQNTEFLKRLETYCTQGYSNKLVFFTRTGLTIVNAQAGQYRDGLWYSNCTAFPTPKLKPYTKSDLIKTPTPVVSTLAISQETRERIGDIRRKKILKKRSRLVNEQYDPTLDADDVYDYEHRIPARRFLKETIDEQQKWENYVNKKYGVNDGVVRDIAKEA